MTTPSFSSLGGAIAADVSGVWFASLLALSLIGCVAGVFAFRGAWQGGGTRPEGRRRRTTLYWISLLPSVIWYGLPFLPQTRFPALLDGVRDGAPFALVVGGGALVLALWNGREAMRVVAENTEATGRSMAAFLQPAFLVRQGRYGKVRHPMFLRDFLTHAGLAVATGALTTVVLLPLYFILSAAFNVSEERWVLKPRFGDAFIAYKAAVPGYMTAGAAGSLAVLFAGVLLVMAV